MKRYALILSLLLLMPSVTLYAQTDAEEPVTASQVNRALRFSGIGQQMAEYLEQIRQRINNAVGMSDAEKAALRDRLARDISFLQGESLRLGKERLQEDIDERRERLMQFWEENRRRIQVFISQVASSNIKFTIERFERMEDKVNILIARLETAEANLESINNLAAQFSDQVESARTSYTDALNTFQAIEGSDEPAALLKAGHEDLKKAHASLREARLTFSELLLQIRRALPRPDNATSTQPEIVP